MVLYHASKKKSMNRKWRI